MRLNWWGYLVLAWCIGFATTSQANEEAQKLLDQAVEKKLAAQKLEELGEVIKLAEKAISLGLDKDGTAFAKNLLAGTYSQRGTVFAEICIQSATRNPGNAEWVQLRALATQDLEKSLEFDDQAAEVHFMLARLQLLPAGKRDEAVKLLDKTIELSADKAAVQVKALLVRADIGTDTAKQQADLDKAVKLGSKERDTWRTRGIFYMLRKNDFKSALADLDQASSLDDKDAVTEHLRGLCQLELKQTAEAVKTFTKALALESKNPQTRVQRARANFILKEYQAALEDLNVLLEREAGNTTLLLLRARVRQALGNNDQARADVEAALKTKPGNAAGLEFRSLLAANSGDYQRAIEDCQELLKLAPEQTQLLAQLGILQLLAKQPRAAITTLSKVLEKEPENAVATRMRGDAYLSVGKHAEAVADLDKALQSSSQESSIMNNLAWVLATSPDDKVRNGKRAIEIATKACEVTEYKRPHILSTLAAAYAEANDYDKALEFIGKALALDNDDAEQKSHLEKEQASYKEKKPWREQHNDPDVEFPKSDTPK
jgi:tetratricopeptide (TPR) repeat protein